MCEVRIWYEDEAGQGMRDVQYRQCSTKGVK